MGNFAYFERGRREPTTEFGEAGTKKMLWWRKNGKVWILWGGSKEKKGNGH